MGELVGETSATLGEKLVVRRVARVTGEKVASYLHRTAKDLPPQVGVLVATDAAAADVARDVAMHIAAYSPQYRTREDVPADVVENERRVAEQTAREEGKPEQALPKIIEGRVNAYFKDFVLLEQSSVTENKKTVRQVLDAAGVQILSFSRFEVGQA